SGDGFSTWVGPYTTRTLCGAFVAPYSNDWDHLTGKAEDFCWKSHRNGGTTGVAKSNQPGAAYAIQPNSAPSFYRIANGSNPNGVFMISPEFSDLDSNVNQIRFYASQTGGSAAKHLIIGTLENRDSLNTFSLVDTIYPVRNSAMVEYVVVLDSVPTGHKHIAFVNDGSVPSIFFGIDNFKYEAIPACTAPTALNASHIEATSALITWTAGGSAGLWNVEYGPSGFTQGTGVVTGLTVAKDSLTGLLSNTCYDYYVQEDCGNNQSTWFGPYTFCTPCAVITAPYTENFGQPDFVSTTGFPYNSTMDDCWTVWPNNTQNQNSYKWVVKNGSTASSSTGPHKGYGGSGQYVYTEASNSGTNAFLKTPTIDFSNLNNPTLTFYYHMYGSNMGTLTVRYMHDTIKDTIAVISGQQHTSDTASWTLHYVDLTSYKQMPGEIQFIGTRGSGFRSDMAIDAITIDEAICFDPNSLGTTAIGTFTADLSWIGSASAQEFYVEYGAQGFMQGSGIGTLDTVATNAHQLTGLSADSCYDYYVASGCGASGISNWVGPYTFCTLPTCPKPTGIVIDSIGINEVIFRWTTGGSSNWQYMITTGNQPNGTPIATSIDSIMVSGLNPATKYRIWVRDSCSANDISQWAGPKTFTTNCTTFSMPFSEDFSNMTNNNGLVCWDRSGGSKNWNTFVFTSPSNKLARANFYSWQAGNDAKFTSPEIFVHTNAQLKYKWTHKYWSLYPNDSMYVLSRIAGSATWDTVNVHGGPTFDNPSQTIGTVPLGTPIQETFALPANYVNNNIEIQFHAVSGYGYDVYIDDVIVELDPAFLTCHAPDTLSSSNIGVTAADVAWTSASNSNYQIMYGPGLTAPIGGTMTTSTTNSKTLSNLSAGTKYNFFVREICSPGDTSFWSAQGTFRTMCAPMQLPYNEDFDGANFPAHSNGVTFTLDSCWSREGAWPGYRFVIRSNATPTALTGPSGDVDGTGNFAYIEGSDGSSGDSASLITPLIDLSAATNPYLRYYYHFYGSDIQTFYVSVDDGNGYVNVDTINGQQHTSASAAWTSAIVDLSAFNSADVRIKFQGERSIGVLGDLAFDQLSVFDSVATPICVTPTNFATSNIYCDSINLTWVSDTATLFSTLVWDTAGFDPTVSGNIVNTASSPFALQGLWPGTTYDVYLIDSCNVGTTSPIMIQFTTANAPLPTIQYNWQQMSTTPTNAVVDFNATASSNGTIYSWAVNNGTTLLNGANVQHTYTQNGSDTVHLQVINGCGSSDTSFVVTIQGIDIKESLLSRSLKLYPNPNDGKFRVSFELEGLKSVELNVSNALGQNVYHKSLGNIAGQRNEDIDLANLPKGMYVLQVNANGQESKIRFVVQ
ncbi:MAG: T9SS type A sorting domain-containing protein, partial [Schleiferiaceae bacterium]|nr:T9SS type A sorting domain-containing protein [Schleiferiaceae bacterium]